MTSALVAVLSSNATDRRSLADPVPIQARGGSLWRRVWSGRFFSLPPPIAVATLFSMSRSRRSSSNAKARQSVGPLRTS